MRGFVEVKVGGAVCGGEGGWGCLWKEMKGGGGGGFAEVVEKGGGVCRSGGGCGCL